VTKVVRRRGSNADNPVVLELDTAVDDHRRCEKNSFVLSCTGKRTKEGCDRGSGVGTQFTAIETGKSQFL